MAYNSFNFKRTVKRNVCIMYAYAAIKNFELNTLLVGIFYYYDSRDFWEGRHFQIDFFTSEAKSNSVKSKV